jgi:hypothetical protein
VADVSESDRSEVWISDHEIVGADMPWPINAANPAKIIRKDFLTGQTHTVPIPQCPISTHAYMLPSPNGRWALCCDGTPSQGDKITAVELQTGRSLSWPAQGDCYHYGNCWLADGCRWLQYTTLPQGFLTIHSVDHPQQSVRLQFPGNKEERYRIQMVTTSDHLLTEEETSDDDSQTAPQWAGLDIHEYRLLPSISRLRFLHVSSPPGIKMRWAMISPDGEHIVWAGLQSYVSPVAVWLHRWIKRVPVDPQRRYSLWSSRIDGSQPREIGHLLLLPDDEVPSFRVNWLPDCRRVSFVYKDVLYTVPVNR